MSTLPAVFEFWNGDINPGATRPGYMGLFFKSGSLYTIDEDGVVVSTGLTPTYTADLICFGEVTLNKVFGKHAPGAAVTIVAAEIWAQEAPAGAALQVALIDAGGAALGTALLDDGAETQKTTFGSPLTVGSGDSVRAKITQIGSTAPGAWIHVRLTVR